jgi:3-carboxy-cis,cis-muconate cycloisomerase
MAELFLITHGAVRAMALVAEGLEVRPAAMRRNLEAAGVGFDLGEARRLMQAALDAAEHD